MGTRLTLTSAVLMMLSSMIHAYWAQASAHKSENEIARMTPEQRVDEACEEYARHGFVDSVYQDLLEVYVGRDGIKAVPALSKIVDQYDPGPHEGNTKRKNSRCFAAEGFLSYIDENVVRLRGSEAGKQGIDAMRRLIERMRAAHFDSAESYDSNHRRFQGSIFVLTRLAGVNGCDEAIRNTLRLQYKTSLSEKEFVDYVSYLIAQNAEYPGWSKLEETKHPTERNNAGYPIWYLVVKNPEPHYKAYLQFTAKNKQLK